MTKKDAKNILKHHSMSDSRFDSDNKGFLGMLRPFSGQLEEKNYHEIMAAIRVLASDLRSSEKIDRDVISAIWGICHLTRLWAIDRNCMLQRNNLIQAKQIKKLENWIEIISYSTMMILDGHDNQTAFELYKNE